MAAPALIYCAGGNPRFRAIAHEAGFLYGAQLPDTIYPEFGRLYFADQDWKRPDRSAYMMALAEHRPFMASVLDWEREDQLSEVLAWAEEAAAYVETVMIIPKVMGGIERLPRIIAGKSVRLGYSVPTRHGGTAVPIWEFAGWPVHLLGGSPQAQMQTYLHMASIANVRSIDGNYHQKMAIRYSQYWTPGTARHAKNRYWPRLDESGERVDGDAMYEAFRRSCKNIREYFAKMDRIF